MTPSRSAGATAPPFTAHEGLKIDLAPIPPDAPEARINETEAIEITRAFMNILPDAPVVMVDHGVGYITEEETAVVWLVVMPILDASPYPVGPRCPDVMGPCAWRIDDYSGALVSDQTGKVLRSFVVGRSVDAPEASVVP